MQKRRIIGTIPIYVTTKFKAAPLPDLCRTILATESGGSVGVVMEEISSPNHNNRVREGTLNAQRNFRIRKLTPTECGRLMGVKDSDIALVTQNLSNSGQYHIFGDSIVTTVLMQIFGKMFNIDYKKKTQEAIEEICQHHTS